MATEQTWFVFSFHEHDMMGDEDSTEEASNQEFIQMLASEPWVRGKTGKTGDFAGYCTEGIETLEAFEAYVHEIMKTDFGCDAEQLRNLRFPFGKLRLLIEKGAWRFVGGYFMEFEGNHNDTEIRVLLER